MDTRNDKGESVIHQAVKKGDITRLKQLIEEGHSVNTIDNNSWTPFHEVKLFISRCWQECVSREVIDLSGKIEIPRRSTD